MLYDRQIWKAIAQLADIGLVQVIRRFNSRVLKVAAFWEPIGPEAGEEFSPESMTLDAENWNKSSGIWNKSSKIEASKSDSSVPNRSDLSREQTARSSFKQEGSGTQWAEVDDLQSLEISESGDRSGIEQEAIRQVRDAGIGLNPTIQAVILQYVAQEGQKALERVRNAVEAVAEQIQRGNARTPAAQLVNAIRRGWTSNARKRMNRQQAGVSPGPDGGGGVDSGGERSSPAVASPAATVEPAAEPMVNYQGYVPVCDDLSQVIALLGVEADRLGWKPPEMQQFIQRQFQGRSRRQLQDEELFDLLHLLRQI